MKEEKFNTIYQLLENKDYIELSKFEKDMVLNNMTKDEYEQQRRVILMSRVHLSEHPVIIEPDLEIFNALQKQLLDKSEQRNNTVFTVVWTYKIPAYQAVAAMILLFMGLTLFNTNQSPVKEYVTHEKIVYQPIHDTLIIEKKVEVPVQKIVLVKMPEQQLQTAQTETPSFANVINDNKPDLKELNKSYGNSSIQPESLNQFRVGM